MRNILFLAAAIIGSLPTVETAQAAVIRLVPSTAVSPPGVDFDADLIAVGLPVGGFDATLDFDSFLVQPQSVNFGLFLGAPASLQSAALGGASIDLAEVSLLPPAELAALQGNSFRLATIRFRALTAGIAVFSSSRMQVSDYDGVLMHSDFEGAQVLIRDSGSSTPIPEPHHGLAALLICMWMTTARSRPTRRTGL